MKKKWLLTARRSLPLTLGIICGALCPGLVILNASALGPNLWLTSPGSGTTVSGTIPLSAQADAPGIVSLQFQVSGQNVGGPITADPCVTYWDTSSVSDGVYTVAVTGHDSVGTTIQAPPATVTVHNQPVTNPNPTDTQPPSVALTAPAGDGSLSGTITLKANASDNVGVTGVWFLVDGAPVGTQLTAAPYQLSWSTAALPNGAHAFSAGARDAAGNAATSTAVSAMVSNAAGGDTTAPSVSVTAPTANATVSGSVVVTASASDNVGVIGVQFTLDGASLGSEDTTAPYQITWNSSQAASGTHTLRAIARDAAGNTKTSAGVSVMVSNTGPDTTAPNVSVTAPAASASVSGPVVVTASASDNVGVIGVQFTLDGANLGSEVKTAPYQTTWLSGETALGAHTLRAIARDAAGNTRTSTAVSVTSIAWGSDKTAPTVAVTSPLMNAALAGTVTISASASDNVGVAKVRFTIDNAVVGEDTSAPYQFTWNTKLVTSGSHVIRAIAFDAAGNSSTSAAITVSVGVTSGNLKIKQR